MTFVSYAQNYEDVMLARVFPGLDAGFYIDIGAQDPRIDSVTKAFYDRGWRGINVEPVEFWYQKLLQDRPRDINLRLAAGAAQGVVDFFEIADTGLSTSSVEFAQRHQAQGHELTSRKVQVLTLDAICAEHGVEVVHFLKIDAEGAEADVLRGIDLARLRPWVILVEATEPNSTVSTHAQWESLLVDRGYRFVYDDGLNRFYLASEHSALSAAFATPPNVYDDFVLRILVDHQNHEAGLATHIAAIEDLSLLRAKHIEHIERIIVERDKALTDAHAVQVQIQAELSRSQQFLAERDARLAELRSQFAQLQTERMQLEMQLAQLQTERAQLETHLAQLQVELVHLQTERAQLQADLAARELSLSTLEAVLAEREASLASLRSLVARHEIELRSRQAKIASLAARLQSADRSVADLSLSLIDSEASRLASDAGWAAALAENAKTLSELALAQQHFQEIISSRSWRLTSPLRRAMTLLVAVRAYCLRSLRRLSRWAMPRRLAAPIALAIPGAAAAIEAQSPDSHHPGDVAIESAPPPRPLAISADAEQILARCPVLDPARNHEGAD